jgi:hypothetical protein
LLRLVHLIICLISALLCNPGYLNFSNVVFAHWKWDGCLEKVEFLFLCCWLFVGLFFFGFVDRSVLKPMVNFGNLVLWGEAASSAMRTRVHRIPRVRSANAVRNRCIRRADAFLPSSPEPAKCPVKGNTLHIDFLDNNTVCHILGNAATISLILLLL